MCNFPAVNRDSESRLLAFCVEQRRRFDAAAWVRFAEVSRPDLAVVARYLAGVAWYGNQPALRAAADALNENSFASLVRETAFDPGRFAGLLQAHLRHAGHAVAA